MTISPDLSTNKTQIEQIYRADKSKDFKTRDFVVTYLGKEYPAFIAYYDGMTNGDAINSSILTPLMLLGSRIDPTPTSPPIKEAVEKILLTHNQIDIHEDFQEALFGITFGGCAVFVEGVPHVFVVETKGFPMRGVAPPQNELVIKGPQQGFVESMRANVSLIRKIIKTERLISEEMIIGKVSNTPVSLMYIEGEAPKEVVSQVKQRLESLAEINYLFDGGEMEQLLENNTHSLFSQTMFTERPDHVAIGLSEGQVAVVVDGSPTVIIMPATMTEFLHAADDKYLRLPYARFNTIIRTITAIIAFTMSGVYVAMASYHHEAFPLELLFAIESTRDKIPFSLVIEVLLLEVAFEFIREASIRVQGVMGGTLGIVGGIILGQAAVEARIVSPVSIVIVALGLLCSFAIPNYYMEFSARILKYVFIVLGYTAGFLGLSAALVLVGISTCSLQTMGVPYLAPFADRIKGYRKTQFLTREKRMNN